MINVSVVANASHITVFRCESDVSVHHYDFTVNPVGNPTPVGSFTGVLLSHFRSLQGLTPDSEYEVNWTAYDESDVEVDSGTYSYITSGLAYGPTILEEGNDWVDVDLPRDSGVDTVIVPNWVEGGYNCRIRAKWVDVSFNEHISEGWIPWDQPLRMTLADVFDTSGSPRVVEYIVYYPVRYSSNAGELLYDYGSTTENTHTTSGSGNREEFVTFQGDNFTESERVATVTTARGCYDSITLTCPVPAAMDAPIVWQSRGYQQVYQEPDGYIGFDVFFPVDTEFNADIYDFQFRKVGDTDWITAQSVTGSGTYGPSFAVRIGPDLICPNTEYQFRILSKVDCGGEVYNSTPSAMTTKWSYADQPKISVKEASDTQVVITPLLEYCNEDIPEWDTAKVYAWIAGTHNSWAETIEDLPNDEDWVITPATFGLTEWPAQTYGLNIYIAGVNSNGDVNPFYFAEGIALPQGSSSSMSSEWPGIGWYAFCPDSDNYNVGGGFVGYYETPFFIENWTAHGPYETEAEAVAIRDTNCPVPVQSSEPVDSFSWPDENCVNISADTNFFQIRNQNPIPGVNCRIAYWRVRDSDTNEVISLVWPGEVPNPNDWNVVGSYWSAGVGYVINVGVGKGLTPGHNYTIDWQLKDKEQPWRWCPGGSNCFTTVTEVLSSEQFSDLTSTSVCQTITTNGHHAVDAYPLLQEIQWVDQWIIRRKALDTVIASNTVNNGWSVSSLGGQLLISAQDSTNGVDGAEYEVLALVRHNYNTFTREWDTTTLEGCFVLDVVAEGSLSTDDPDCEIIKPGTVTVVKAYETAVTIALPALANAIGSCGLTLETLEYSPDNGVTWAPYGVYGSVRPSEVTLYPPFIEVVQGATYKVRLRANNSYTNEEVVGDPATFTFAEVKDTFCGNDPSFAGTTVISDDTEQVISPYVPATVTDEDDWLAYPTENNWALYNGQGLVLQGALGSYFDVTKDVTSTYEYTAKLPPGLLYPGIYQLRFLYEDEESVHSNLFCIEVQDEEVTECSSGNYRYLHPGGGAMVPESTAPIAWLSADHWEVRDSSNATVSAGRIGVNGTPGFKAGIKGSGQISLFVPVAAVEANDYKVYVKTLDGRCAMATFDVVESNPCSEPVIACEATPPEVEAGSYIDFSLYDGLCPTVNGSVLATGWTLRHIDSGYFWTEAPGVEDNGFTATILNDAARSWGLTTPFDAPDGIYELRGRVAGGACFSGCLRINGASLSSNSDSSDETSISSEELISSSVSSDSLESSSNLESDPASSDPASSDPDTSSEPVSSNPVSSDEPDSSSSSDSMSSESEQSLVSSESSDSNSGGGDCESPDKPGNLILVSKTDTTVTVTLPALPENASSLRVWKAPHFNGPWTETDSTDYAGGATVNITGLSPSTLYYFAAVAWLNSDPPQARRGLSLAVTTNIAAPAVPGLVTAGLIGRYTIDLILPALPARATGLYLEYSLDGDTWNRIEDSSGEVSFDGGDEYTLEGLTPDTEYFFRAVSWNTTDEVEGPESSATTLKLAAGLPGEVIYDNVEASRMDIVIDWNYPIRCDDLTLYRYTNSGRTVMKAAVAPWANGTVVVINLKNLTPGDQYDLRWVASNNSGEVLGPLAGQVMNLTETALTPLKQDAPLHIGDITNVFGVSGSFSHHQVFIQSAPWKESSSHPIDGVELWRAEKTSTPDYGTTPIHEWLAPADKPDDVLELPDPLTAENLPVGSYIDFLGRGRKYLYKVRAYNLIVNEEDETVKQYGDYSEVLEVDLISQSATINITTPDENEYVYFIRRITMVVTDEDGHSHEEISVRGLPVGSRVD